MALAIFNFHCYLVTLLVALSFSISLCENKVRLNSNNGFSVSFSFRSWLNRLGFAEKRIHMHGCSCCDSLSYGVMTSWRLPASDFLGIHKGHFVFCLSLWMIISPSWEQSVDFMTKDFQVRQSDKSLFKNELSVQFKMISTRVLKKFIPYGSSR